MPLNPAIAHRLVRELAAVGIAEFQADLGILYSVGVEPVAPNDDDFLFILKEPDLDLAMLHFSFATKGDDPLARMALGFRHYHVGLFYATYIVFLVNGVMLTVAADAGSWS